ncbi:uncharacterized protein METZ01_LOCUS40490 [marine metagenome]|uniref:Uncharacterized protein n=1 Tax=marine metagenome TaxID=408172 RepID=A0A381R7A6_9ZZZZ
MKLIIYLKEKSYEDASFRQRKGRGDHVKSEAGS